ncbi:DUF7133 domain-containing protein [Verrucomicrobiota bacterium sgz303538]
MHLVSPPRFLIQTAAILSVLCFQSIHAAAAEPLRTPSSGQTPPVKKNANAISVLLIGGQNNHDWKIGNEFLVTLLNRQPGISVVESNTPDKDAPASEWAAWNPQFEKYQCVILDYNGKDWPAAVQRSFEKYVADGGTAMLIHAANNSFTGWKEYEKMAGLLWRSPEYGASLYLDDSGKVMREEAGNGRGMGHGKQWDWLTVRDVNNPITAGMPQTWKHVKDELYHGQRGPAENVNIILSAFDDPKYNGLGKHEPIVWWVPYGKGKVLTNVMGHVGESSAPLSCVGFQTVFLRSIEWLATGRCSTTIPEDFPTAERTSQRYPGTPIKARMEALTPQQALARIKVPAGYHLELVASDPMITSPVMCTWDGNGRMYVAEMRTYMKDVDATGENEPTSRVSMLTDTNGDGVMDKATPYAENLVLPRMVLPLDDRVVIAETYTGKFVSYRDTNGDGIADEKKELYDGGPAKANLEHQDSGLLWGTDNYLYTAQLGSRRFRFTRGTWEVDPIYGAGTQWGLGMDDMGRMFCSAAGSEKPAYGFQQHPSYGSLLLPGETDAAFDEPFPTVQTLDLQGGLGRVHNIKGTLNHFTGICGQSIFRGDRLPKDLYGDFIVPEPVGRLVRRAKVNVVEGKRVLTNAYPGDEFITSTDLAFRPVWSATGPDGCLYIVDLHNGIVQESAWVTPGSYLRETVLREGYDKYAGHGRIYRLVADGFKPGSKPNMLNETVSQLVAHLSHPNGWWRDTAQKLIVLKGDKSVVPALKKLAQSGGSPLGRVHALWTLDGLDSTDRSLLVAAFSDKDERVRSTAVRISESFLRKGDAALVESLKPLLKDSSTDVVVQVINSLRYVPEGAAKPLIETTAASFLGNEIVTASAQQSLQFDPAKPSGITVNIDPVGLALMKKGREQFTAICFACHGADGKGVVTSDKVQLAPPLAGSPRVLGSPEALVRIILNGLTGEVDGKSYPGAMIPQKANDDLWIAQVLTYIRNSFGNNAPTITPEEVARIRKAAGDRSPYTMGELADYLAVPRETMKNWVFSASENTKEVRRAIDGDLKTRWSTNTPREVGQWFQFDMGKRYQISRLTIDTSGSKGDFPKKYELLASDDGVKWSPLSSGDGKTVLTIDLPQKPVTRFLRIVQNTKQGGFWSIHELGVYGTEAK